MLDMGRWCRGRGRRRTKEKNMQRGNVRVGGAHATKIVRRDWLSPTSYATARLTLRYSVLHMSEWQGSGLEEETASLHYRNTLTSESPTMQV